MIVEGSNPDIASMGAAAPATDVDQAVAKYIVNEIPDGACLQLGIGGMPNAVGSLIAESDLKDLGVHTEMYVDAFVDHRKSPVKLQVFVKTSIKAVRYMHSVQEHKSCMIMSMKILNA